MGVPSKRVSWQCVSYFHTSMFEVLESKCFRLVWPSQGYHFPPTPPGMGPLLGPSEVCGMRETFVGALSLTAFLSFICQVYFFCSCLWFSFLYKGMQNKDWEFIDSQPRWVKRCPLLLLWISLMGCTFVPLMWMGWVKAGKLWICNTIKPSSSYWCLYCIHIS